MRLSFTPLSLLEPESLIVSRSQTSSLKLLQPFCWIDSVLVATGSLGFKTFECSVLSLRDSCKFRLNLKQRIYRRNFYTLNPQREHFTQLQAYPYVCCSVANTSDFTSGNSASPGPFRHKSTELSLLNVSEEVPSLSVRSDVHLGKIFVGNLPHYVKKEAVQEFFSKCGPVQDIFLVRNNSDPQKKKRGYCFLFFGGPDPHSAAMRAVELDGAEFYGKLLRVKVDYRSWQPHEKEKASNTFKKLIEEQPKEVRKVVNAFKRIDKAVERDYALLIHYYGKRGDKRGARVTFEKMRAAGIDSSVHAYNNLIRAYIMAQNLQGAVSCVEEMEIEGIFPNAATFSAIISGYGSSGNVEEVVPKISE